MTTGQGGGFVNRFNKFLVTAFMSASLLLPNMVQATEIRELDHMSGDDQIRFVDKLIDSVEDASKSDPALLARVKRFFMNKQPGEVIDGMGRFELNLSLARIADMDSAAKNPKARRLEVEDVMYTTLERSGIILGNTFRPSASNFHPQQPLSDKYLTGKTPTKLWRKRRSGSRAASNPNTHLVTVARKPGFPVSPITRRPSRSLWLWRR